VEWGDAVVVVLYLVCIGARIWLDYGNPTRDWFFWVVMAVSALYMLVLPAVRAWRHW